MNQSEDSDDDGQPVDAESELNRFRDRWRAEIQDKRPQSVQGHITPGHCEDLHERAKEMFMNRVWCEQNGFTYEALDHYRRATKMVPDIDIKMAQHYRRQNPTVKDMPAEVTEESESDRDDIDDLCHHFQQLCTSDDRILTYCTPEETQSKTHISCLPTEVLYYILQWVVSADLDVRSLEQFSMVCRGFYLLARDTRLWQLICTSIWGMSCQSLHPYGSWRAMCIQRPHLYFNGVYMNKVELMRQGEATLDKFYPPWMKVIYFRYLRFFPDGLVFMHTSPQDPVSTVSQLRSSTAALEGMCRGMYRIQDENTVFCMLKRVKRKEPKLRVKRKTTPEQQEGETTFLLELRLSGTSSRPNTILHWLKYTISVYYAGTQTESTSDFELTKSTFPSMQFARVKSYTAQSEAPLGAEQ